MNDLTGQKIGYLAVIRPTNKRKRRYIIWLCQCDCGNVTEVRSDHLSVKDTSSCGCLQKERTQEAQYIHGETGTRLYRIWRGMKQRCSNLRLRKYKYYGGRGIEVCSEWRKYLNFRDWACINGYQDHLTIDRINNDGNYEPSNCEWVTKAENTTRQHAQRKEKGI